MVHRPRELAFALLASAQCSNKFPEPVHCKPLRTELSATFAACPAVYNKCGTSAMTYCLFARTRCVWQHLHLQSIAQCCAAVSHTPRDACNCTPLNLGALYIKCSPQQSQNNSLRRVDFQFDFSAARRLFDQEMNAEADERLYTDVTIRKLKVDSKNIERVRECAIFEVMVKNLDRAYLAVVAGEGFITLRDSLYARLTAVGPPLSKLYRASLIATDMDAHKLNVRTLAGDIIAVIAYRFKCYSLRVARDIGEMVIARYKERVYSCRPAVKY